MPAALLKNWPYFIRTPQIPGCDYDIRPERHSVLEQAGHDLLTTRMSRGLASGQERVA